MVKNENDLNTKKRYFHPLLFTSWNKRGFNIPTSWVKLTQLFSQFRHSMLHEEKQSSCCIIISLMGTWFSHSHTLRSGHAIHSWFSSNSISLLWLSSSSRFALSRLCATQQHCLVWFQRRKTSLQQLSNWWVSARAYYYSRLLQPRSSLQWRWGRWAPWKGIQICRQVFEAETL